MLEAVCAFSVSVGIAWSARSIQVDPLDRVGQVSALASIGVRVIWVVGPVLMALVIALRVRSGAYFPRVTRFACAALSGVACGMLAAGIIVATRGTPYGLNGAGGDSGVLASWAHDVLVGHEVPSAVYPPAQVYVLAALARLLDTDPLYAMKAFEILGLVAVGPFAYLAWRLWLPPAWALGIGVVAALPMIEAYRPFPLLVLAVFVPVMLRFLRTLRHAALYDPLVIARRGVMYGLVLGSLLLLYSGWFLWSGPGVVIACAIAFPWRTAPRPAVLLCALAALVFALLVAHYALGMMRAPALKDVFLYFETNVDPAYISMWRGDVPGPFNAEGTWPPIGEMGGVGIFTMVLFAGAGFAIATGRARTVIYGLGALVVSAWVQRFWKAHYMFKTKLPQLYPRTTAQILYCLLLLCGFGIYYHVRQARARADADSALHSPWSTLGVAWALAMLFVSAGSSLADRYMPTASHGFYGELAYAAQLTPRLASSQTLGVIVTTSSIRVDSGDPKVVLTDGDPRTVFSSAIHTTPDAEEWIELEMPHINEFDKVVLTPAADGFPVGFVVELWDDTHWVQRCWRRNEDPRTTPLWLYWGRYEYTPRIRIRATKLGKVPGGYALRLGELELYK